MSRFLQHNLRLVVLGKCLLIVVMKFQDKFARLQQLLNSPNGQDKFQIWCINMYSIWFLANFAVFRMFLWILRVYLNFAAPWPRWISEALILWAASFTLYKLATIFLQLVTKGQPEDFLILALTTLLRIYYIETTLEITCIKQIFFQKVAYRSSDK